LLFRLPTVTAFILVLSLVLSACAEPDRRPHIEFDDTPAPSPPAPTVEPRRIALGVWVAGLPWDTSGLKEQEQATGRRNAVVNVFWSWDAAVNPPEVHLLNSIYERDAIPLISWMPWHHAFGHIQPAFSLAQILSGRYDAYILRTAQAISRLPGPVMLRFAHEMNGDWYPWGLGISGNRPDQYVAVWRHVHSLFEQAGADNVYWVWSPNIDNADPALFFPGDEYVDWVGLVGFNNSAWGLWRTFSEIFGPTYQRITEISARPVIITEVGTTEGSARVGGDKAAWIRNMYLDEIPNRFPRIKAVIWFDEDKSSYGEGDYRINTSPEALAAYRQAVSSSLYTSSLDLPAR
jgi:hypothetical protein